MVSTDSVDPHKLLGGIRRPSAFELPLSMPCLVASDTDLACHDYEQHAILPSVTEVSNVDSPSAHAVGLVAVLEFSGAL